MHVSMCAHSLWPHSAAAGTNNARLAGMLRNLSSYYYKEPVMLFLVRTAQGLVHMGKGLLSITPYHTDKQLLSGEGHARRHVAGCWSACLGMGGLGMVVSDLQGLLALLQGLH